MSFENKLIDSDSGSESEPDIEVQSEQLVDFNITEKLKSISHQFSTLRSNYNILRRKLQMQKGRKTPIGLVAKLHFVESDISSLNDSFERAIIGLDSQGHWALTEEDIDRIKSNEEAMKLLREFLPQMIRHQIIDNQARGISDWCTIS